MAMTAEDFNQLELTSGRLTIAEITALVRFYQERSGIVLDVDGKAGKRTQEAIGLLLPEAALAPPPDWRLEMPMPTLGDGREPYITSAFKPPDRPNHVGIDLFYAWRKGDRPGFVGDKGAAGKNADGTPRHVVPYGVHAIAAASGVVQIAGNSKTGFRLWIDHGNGWRTGYFHLLDLRVAIGQLVTVGAPLGQVGDNPDDHDGRHLHFELSPSDRYAPIDPAPYLVS